MDYVKKTISYVKKNIRKFKLKSRSISEISVEVFDPLNEKDVFIFTFVNSDKCTYLKRLSVKDEKLIISETIPLYGKTTLVEICKFIKLRNSTI